MNLKSLVGVTLEYRVKGAVIPDTFGGTREEISATICEAVTVGKEGIPLLAEMWGYYSAQPYFVSIRGSFVFGRLRGAVEEWLKQNSETRVIYYIEMMERKKFPHRESYLKAIKYLLKVHPRYIKDFKPVLSAEEYEYIR